MGSNSWRINIYKMAKWTVSSSSFSATASEATGAQVVELVISPTQGFNIEAKNFKIGKGSEVSTNKWVATGGVFWNADPNVESVLFENRHGVDGFVDDSLVGNPNNKVKVSVKLNSFTAPSESTTLYIDIDEREDNPIVTTGEELLGFCLDVTWQHPAFVGDDQEDPYAHFITLSSVGSDVSASDAVLGGCTLLDPCGGEIRGRLMGTAPKGVRTLVGTAVFQLREEHLCDYTLDVPLPSLSNETDWSVEGKIARACDHSNKLTSSTWEIYHTAPDDADLDPYCPGGSSQDKLTFNQTCVPITPKVLNTINSITYSSSATSQGGNHQIQAHGAAGSSYSISVQKKTSTTSGVTASSNGHYNFATRSFQTADKPLNSVIGAFGVTKHQLVLPPVASDTRYDITISGLVDGSQTALASGVPVNAGDATITQRGINTLTITPITHTSSNFGTLPADITVSRPIRFKGDGYSNRSPNTITLKGGNAGVSSTRLTLNKHKPSINITPGMIVTGGGIGHNVTVAEVKENVVTLSGAYAIPALTEITFTSDTGNIKAFSFTVVPNAGGDALSVTAVTDLFSNVGGLSLVKNRTNAAAAKTATHTLDSTKGIVPGMVVMGDQVKVKAGANLTVDSVTNGTTIVLSEIQSFTDNTNLRFSNGNTTGSTSVHSMQVNKVGDNIVVTGYINATSLGATAQARVYIDDIITVA